MNDLSIYRLRKMIQDLRVRREIEWKKDGDVINYQSLTVQIDELRQQLNLKLKKSKK